MNSFNQRFQFIIVRRRVNNLHIYYTALRYIDDGLFIMIPKHRCGQRHYRKIIIFQKKLLLSTYTWEFISIKKRVQIKHTVNGLQRGKTAASLKDILASLKDILLKPHILLYISIKSWFWSQFFMHNITYYVRNLW